MKSLKFNPRVVVKSQNHSLRFSRRNLTNSVHQNNNNNNFKPQGTSNANTQNQSPPAAGGFDSRIPSSSPSSTASNLDQGSSHSSSVKREFQEQQPSSGRAQVSGWGSSQGQSWASPREENKNTSGKTFDKSKPSHGVEDQQLGNSNSNSNSTMESNLSSSLQRKNANTARDWNKSADPVNSNVASQSDWDQELVSQKLTPKKATNQNISSNQQNRKFTTTPYATSSYNRDSSNNNQKPNNLDNSQGSDNINKGKDEHNLHNYTGSTTPQSEMSGVTGYGGRSGIERDDGSRSSSSSPSSINSGNSSSNNNNNNNSFNNKSGEEESVADQLSKAVSQVIGRSETNTASTGEGNPNTVLGAIKTGAEKTVEFASNIKKKAMDMVDTLKNEFSSEQSPSSSSSNKSESSSLGPDMMYGRNTASNKQSQEKKESGFDSSTAAFDQVFGSDIKPDQNTLSRTKRVPPGSQSNDLGTTTGTTRGTNQGGSIGSSGLGSTGSGFGGSSSSSSPSQSSQSSSSSIPSGKSSNNDWNKI